MILLDTNVISEFMRDVPEKDPVIWLDRQPPSSIWTTSISVYEIRSGLLAMPAGKRQALRILAFERVLNDLIQGRIAAFDHAAAQRSAELEAAGLKAGRPRETRDTMIAGIVLSNHAMLATRNVKHFDNMAKSVVNPWG
ncbi:MAG: type II toxin-antitoxin system VapC family toxin [Candidatus Korobacteraceae bacterium]|jgi:predicted nucleic acid-binding protein